MLDLDLLACFAFLFNPAVSAALFADAKVAWLHGHNVRVVASCAVRDHMRAAGSSYLYVHSVSWSTDMECCDWLLVHTWGHIYLSRVSLLHTTWGYVNLGWVCLLGVASHRLLLRVAAHGLALRVASHRLLLRIASHWLLLRIASHRLSHRLPLRIAAHRLLLRVATHWLLLRISTHWLLLGIAWLPLRIPAHWLLLRIATHWLLLLRLDCNSSANLSAGNLAISVD